MLPPSLRQLLRDASWIEAVVQGGEVSAPSPRRHAADRDAEEDADSTALPQSQGCQVREGGARLSGSKLAEAAATERPRLSGRAFSSRRSLSLFERMDLVAEGDGAPDAVPPFPLPLCDSQDGNPPETARGASGCTPCAPSASLPTPAPGATAATAVASVKLACHLTEGVALLVSDGHLELWLGYLSLNALREVVHIFAPAIALPLHEMLTRLERCVWVGGASDETEDAGSVCVVTRGSNDVAAFSRHLGACEESPPLTPELSAPPPEVVEVRLCSPVTVLHGYKLPLVVPIECTRLKSEAELRASNTRQHTASRLPTGSTASCSQLPSREAMFLEMVHEPQQAQIVALSEALLLLCTECGRAPQSVASSMTTVYQQRYQRTVLTAQERARTSARGQEAEGGDGSMSSSAESLAMAATWRAHRGVAAGLLRGLQVPPALHGFHAFAIDLLHFAKGEPNRLVEGPTGTIAGVGHPRPVVASEADRKLAGTPQPLPQPRSDGGVRDTTAEGPRAGAAPAEVLNHSERRKRTRAEVSTAAAPTVPPSGAPSKDAPASPHAECSAMLPGEPSAVSSPAPTRSVAAEDADADGKKKKRIRKLFS